MRDLLQVERFILPSPSPLLVQNVGNLAITVVFQQLVNLGDDLRLGFANLCNRQWLHQSQASCGAAAEANMGLDHFSIDPGRF